MENNHPTLLKRQAHRTSMRSVAALAVVALLAVSVAGCSSKDPERYPNGVPSSSSTSRASSSSSYTWPPSSSGTLTGPANETGHAPTGSLQATLNGTAAAFRVNGTDADGDALHWTLDYGDGNATNGTTLPATLAHNYTLPANATALNVTARLTLSDGHLNATYDAILNVTAGAASQAYSGGFLSSNIACGGAPGVSYDTVPDSQGTAYDKVDVLPATIGLPFKVVFASAATMDHLVFVDAANAVLADHAAGLPGTSWEATGTVPAGAAAAVFYGCGTITQPNDSVPPSGIVGESFDYSSPPADA
jgi:hypothetical protein